MKNTVDVQFSICDSNRKDYPIIEVNWKSMVPYSIFRLDHTLILEIPSALRTLLDRLYSALLIEH